MSIKPQHKLLATLFCRAARDAGNSACCKQMIATEEDRKTVFALTISSFADCFDPGDSLRQSLDRRIGMGQRAQFGRHQIAQIGKLVAEFANRLRNARGAITVGAHIAAQTTSAFLNRQSQNLAMHKVLLLRNYSLRLTIYAWRCEATGLAILTVWFIIMSVWLFKMEKTWTIWMKS
ncbi:hypothetical protein D9M69_620700 [compost metagenome]